MGSDGGETISVGGEIISVGNEIVSVGCKIGVVDDEMGATVAGAVAAFFSDVYDFCLVVDFFPRLVRRPRQWMLMSV